MVYGVEQQVYGLVCSDGVHDNNLKSKYGPHTSYKPDPPGFTEFYP